MNTPLVIRVRLSFDFILGNFGGITDNNEVVQGCQTRDNSSLSGE